MYDIRTTYAGDIEFIGGDIDTVDQELLMKQIVVNVLRTGNPDWVEYPNIAPNIPEYIGEINNKETSYRIATIVKNKLNNLGFSSVLSFDVIPVPTDYDELLLRIIAPTGFNISMTLDFQTSTVTNISVI